MTMRCLPIGRTLSDRTKYSHVVAWGADVPSDKFVPYSPLWALGCLSRQKRVNRFSALSFPVYVFGKWARRFPACAPKRIYPTTLPTESTAKPIMKSPWNLLICWTTYRGSNSGAVYQEFVVWLAGSVKEESLYLRSHSKPG